MPRQGRLTGAAGPTFRRPSRHRIGRPDGSPAPWPRSGRFAFLSALLFYFGWVHTAAQAQYFGFDSTFYDLSSTDYTLRSVSAALPAFATGAIIALAATILYDRVDAALVDRAIRRRVSSVVLLVGAIAVVLGVVRLGADQSTDPAQAVLLLAGGGLLVGGALLGDLHRRHLVVGVAALLVAAGSFQAVRSLASATGRARAEDGALEVDSTSLVRVYADGDLHLTRVGSLVVTALVGNDGTTTYVYDCCTCLTGSATGSSWCRTATPRGRIVRSYTS